MELKDFKSILNNNDIKYSENSSHLILKNCPNCDGIDKLFVSKNNFLWQCFKCKGLSQEDTSRGNLFSFLLKVLHLDELQAKNVLRTNRSFEYTPEKLEERKSETITVQENKSPEKTGDYEMNSNWILLDSSKEQIAKYPEVYKYLIGRHVTNKQTIFKYQLRYDFIKERLVFPAINRYGQLVGVQTRDITNRHKQFHAKCPNFKCANFRKFYWFKTAEELGNCPICNSKLDDTFYPKASNSKEFPKTEFFWGENVVDWTKPVVLVEGPFDVINTPNAIALLGRTLSDTQIFILQNYLKAPLILYLDGDKAGTQSTLDVYKKIQPFVDSINICYLKDGDDPGAFSLKENETKLSKLLILQEWCSMKGVIL